MIFREAIEKRLTTHDSRLTNNKGFTLIELAIVLVIIGILVGLGTALVGPLTKQTKVVDTREAVKAAKGALSGYAVKYGYLPTTIGPSGGRELDAWGRSLQYAVATSLNGAGNACNLTATDRTAFECTNTVCTTYNTKSNLAFIVYSTGEDAEGTGTTTQPTGGPACPSGTCYWIREQASSYTAGPLTYYYDDIVQYVTLDEIRSLRDCSFTITTNTLPDAKVGTAYNVTGVQLQASGGQTPYTSWATGQAQGTCAAGSVRIVASDIGICLNTTSGLISGTPTTAGVYNFTVTLTDANGVQTSKAFTLNVLETLAITNQTLPDAKTGDAYNVTLNGSGGTPAYTWATGQAQGTCAAGSVRIVASDIGICLNTTTGLISGTPTTAGVYNFTVTLTDTNSKTTSRAFTLNVIDSCLATGIYNYNATGVGRGYKILGLGDPCTTAATCNSWASDATITIQTNQTYCFYTTVGAPCSKVCTGTASITYTAAQTVDANKNCLIRFTTGASTCISGDN